MSVPKTLKPKTFIFVYILIGIFMTIINWQFLIFWLICGILCAIFYEDMSDWTEMDYMMYTLFGMKRKR